MASNYADSVPDKSVVVSILEDSADAVVRRFAEIPRGAGLVEIRADRIRPSDVAGLVRRSPRPAVVAVRTAADGGTFRGNEAERRAILAAALEAGAAFVDVEANGPLAELADGPNADRVIVSHHGAPCTPQALAEVYRVLAGKRAARLKIVPLAASVTEITAVRGLLADAVRDGRRLAAFAMGRAGTASRALALHWGSWGTYGPPAGGPDTAEGQVSAEDLVNVYRAAQLSDETRLFGLTGRPVLGSPSPAMHAAGYAAVGLDACYLPMEADHLDDALALCGPEGSLGLEAIGVTIPFKEEAATRARPEDAWAIASGSINTIVFGTGTPRGYNTDAPAALALVRAHLDPKGHHAAVVGAGGTGRAIAAALKQAGARVTVFNRSPESAERVGRALGVGWASLAALRGAPWDLLVNATPLGRGGEEIVSEEGLEGDLVLDAAYGPEPTPLCAAARRRGLAVVDGFDLLAAQAALQFERMTGRAADAGVLKEVGRAWLVRPRVARASS